MAKFYTYVIQTGMNFLEIAIKDAGGIARLAEKLDIKPNVISNWRTRGVPRGWETVLRIKFRKQIAEAKKLA
jgi:hypothetical protein